MSMIAIWIWLALLALSCAIIALARPQWGEKDVTVFQRGRDLLIALDVSRSMLANDVHPSRLGRAKADVLMICGNDDIVVMKQAAQFYRSGYCDYVLCSGGVGRLTVSLIQNAQSHYQLTCLEPFSECADREIRMWWVEAPDHVGSLRSGIKRRAKQCRGYVQEDIRKWRKNGMAIRRPSSKTVENEGGTC